MEDAAVTDIGSRLKQARERRNLTLAEIADSTKIPIHILESIERNDFARLPGGLFRRAFIKAYAAEVDLDGDALASEYHETVEIDCAALALAASAAARRRVSRRRSWRSVAAFAGVLLGAWLVWTLIGVLRQRGGESSPIASPIESVPASTRGPATSAGRRRSRSRRRDPAPARGAAASSRDSSRPPLLGLGVRRREARALSRPAARREHRDRGAGRD